MKTVYRRKRNISAARAAENMRACAYLPVYAGDRNESGPVVICAAGPSLMDHIETVQRLQNVGAVVCSVKGVADILYGYGIKSDYIVFMDGQPNQSRFIETVQTGEYLLCSIVDQSVFEKLHNAKVTVWHYHDDEDGPPKSGICYVRASNSATAAIQLMRGMGYGPLHLVGFDCCYEGAVSHVYNKGAPKPVEMYVGDRQFTTTVPLIGQHNQLVELFFEANQPDAPGLQVIAYGDNALTEAMAIMADDSERLERAFMSRFPLSKIQIALESPVHAVG